jgi:hypothetical protein
MVKEFFAKTQQAPTPVSTTTSFNVSTPTTDKDTTIDVRKIELMLCTQALQRVLPNLCEILAVAKKWQKYGNIVQSCQQVRFLLFILLEPLLLLCQQPGCHKKERSEDTTHRLTLL